MLSKCIAGAFLLGAIVSGGGFSGGGQNVAPPAASSVTSSFVMSRSSAVTPAAVHFDATGSSTTISARNTDRECKHVWTFGDSWASGTDGYEYGTADSSKTKNWFGHGPWAAHVYEEPHANWDPADDSGTAHTVRHDITCLEDDGTSHTDFSTQTFTTLDFLAEADTDDGDSTGNGAENAVCIRDNSAPAWIAPCDDTTIFPDAADRVTMASGDDICGTINTQEATYDYFLVQHAADGVFKCNNGFAVNSGTAIYVIGGDLMSNVEEVGFTGSETFFSMNANTIMSGLEQLSSDSANTYTGTSFGAGANHALVYRSGSQGIAACHITDTASGGVAQPTFWMLNYCDNLGNTGTANAYFMRSNGTAIAMNNYIDRNGVNEHGIRMSCSTDGGIVAMNSMLDPAGGGNSGITWRDSCSVPSRAAQDAVDNVIAWNIIATSIGGTTGIGLNPQNTIVVDERQERFVMEGNILFPFGNCGGVIPNTLYESQARYAAMRHSVMVDQRGTSCSGSSALVRHSTTVNNCNTKLSPDFDPPSGCVAKQQGSNDLFNSLVVAESGYSANQGVWDITHCTVGSGSDVDRCGDAYNVLSVGNDGSTLSASTNESNEAGSVLLGTTDPDTYFVAGGYDEADAWDTLTVDDFKRATPATDGTCDPRMFWHADGTDYTWDSCSSGLYD